RAVEASRPDLANLLIFEGANPNIAAKDGRTPLMQALTNLGIEGQRMTALLLLSGADLHATSAKGVTPLIATATAGHDIGVLWLMGCGVDPLAPTPKGSLMNYVAHGPTASLLASFGVQKEEKPPETNPVVIMFEAAKLGDVAGVERQLLAGVAADTEYDVERTAMDWAATYGHYKVVDVLLRYGADINKQFKTNGRHLLHDLAAWGGTQGDSKVAAKHIQKLLEAGANPNIAMNDGRTPLMAAARAGVTGANTELLLQAGAELNARDKEGRTALGIARKYGRPEMVKFLQDRGATE
ncbi:MAG TPA: ankyrin repeat domain-containing protein, partial [Chthoniobacteraceae bacterium]